MNKFYFICNLQVEKAVGIVGELAMVVIQEKQLLEECLDLFKYISALEVRKYILYIFFF